QARRNTPPNRVRHPAGCLFASGCSPPHLTETQLPSATCVVTPHDVDSHHADRATSQTHSCPAKAGHPVTRGLSSSERSVVTGSPAFAGDDEVVPCVYSLRF